MRGATTTTTSMTSPEAAAAVGIVKLIGVFDLFALCCALLLQPVHVEVATNSVLSLAVIIYKVSSKERQKPDSMKNN